ncbi:MAG TPA: PhoH family protein [Candidatus Nanoarchaeia archaeon]|nr:PhoH family protein [Candidatus Nanoarchaeia archaeon]
MNSETIPQIGGYHDVRVPLTDVYELAGPDVFKEFEGKGGNRNLVVMPLVLSDRLEETKKGEGSGEYDTLKRLKEIVSSPRENPREGVSIYRVSEGLDLALVDRPLVDPENFSVTGLEKVVADNFSCPENHPAIITTRPSLHVKLSSRGMRVEDPEFLLIGPDIVQEGIIQGNDKLLAKLQENSGELPLEEAVDLLGRKLGLYQHQFVNFGGGNFARVTGEYQRNRGGTRIIDVKEPKVLLLNQQEKSKKLRIGNMYQDNVLGITPNDMEQYLALQYGLLNSDVELFFLCGGAGSGKTILSYVAAVDQILCYNSEERHRRGERGDEKTGRFHHIVLLKPFETMGGKRREVGFLPGSLYDKIRKQLDSFADAHKKSILGDNIPFEAMFLHPKYSNEFEELRSKEISNIKIGGRAHLPPHWEAIELTYSGFLRGRSFQDTLVLIDEAQNFTPYEIKTIIARMGFGCKVIVMGDPYNQIDNPLCSPTFNGLTHAIQKFLPEPYSGELNLPNVYRSQMAEHAANWAAYQ